MFAADGSSAGRLRDITVTGRRLHARLAKKVERESRMSSRNLLLALLLIDLLHACRLVSAGKEPGGRAGREVERDGGKRDDL